MDARRLPLSEAPAQETPADDPALWYKDAVIYQLNVKAFFDSIQAAIFSTKSCSIQ